jgi:DNA-binding CsgD family transcriptional regulator
MAILRNARVASTLGESFTWEKDRQFRYTRCNEQYAEAAGLDSPSAIVGKTDDQMPWRRLADYFRAGDQTIMNSEGLDRHLVQEKEIAAYGEMDILVCEKPLLDSNGKAVGVVGNFVNITGKVLVTPAGSFSLVTGTLDLGPEFGGATLSHAEARVLEKLLLHWSAPRIAEHLGNSPRTIEHHIDAIKGKLQCRTLGDVVQSIVKSGVHLTLLGVGPQLDLRRPKKP